jgi:hypothetical protein
MTIPPPARLVRLHLDSRRTRGALVSLAGIALVLRAGAPVATDAGLFSQLTLMLITVAAAAVIAASTDSPFGEGERAAGSPLPALRLIHLAVLTATATATVAIAGSTGSYGVGTAAIVRNLAGLTGVALLAAALVGAHLAWTAPLGYVMFCGGELDLQVSNLWTWPTRPAGDHAATAVAVALLIAGIAVVAVKGARLSARATPP